MKKAKIMDFFVFYKWCFFFLCFSCCCLHRGSLIVESYRSEKLLNEEKKICENLGKLLMKSETYAILLLRFLLCRRSIIAHKGLYNMYTYLNIRDRVCNVKRRHEVRCDFVL